MKKALAKDSIKEIKNTYKRFISILLMAFLGVGFFAGIKATSPDMVDTINNFYNTQNVFDIQVISTLGLTKDDISELSQIEEINQIVGTYETDGKINIDNKEIIVKTICIEDINKPVLLQGRLPDNQDECVVEEKFLKANDKKIGDIIDLNIENTTNDAGEEIKYLKENKLKIVGTVESSLYITRDRGTSKLGSGQIDYFAYISKSNINLEDIYTNIYIKIKDADKYTTSTKKYENYIESVKNKVDNIKEGRENARYSVLVDTATKKVQDAEATLNKEKTDAENKIKQAEEKIEDAKTKIHNAETEIKSNEKTASKEFDIAEKQLENAKQTLSNNENEFNQKEIEANKQFAEAENKKNELQKNLSQIEINLNIVKTNYNKIIEQLEDSNLTEEQRLILEQNKINLEKQKQILENNKKELVAGITQIENSISNGKNEISNGKKEIEQAKKDIENNQKTLNSSKTSTYRKLDNAKIKLDNAKVELAEGKEELNKNRKEFEEKISEAEGKLIDAREKIADIKNPKWYVLDRYSNAGYNSFIQDTQSIANIGKVFPIVFFVVATLISLTSMTRMVEEQRTQIGTLKALGYTKIQIAGKYVIYATLACVIGSILGMCVGFNLIPSIIWEMYTMMYQIRPIILSFNIIYGGLGLLLISLCIVGATVYASIKELIQLPAVLMRPKAPKMGKRVLLERFPFIWKKLSFSNKVTVRNIFRYKKRFLMTIIGIFGCTSLMVAGFGLKDSIGSILPSQYEEIFDYDLQISLKNELEEDQKQNYIQKLKDKNEISEVVETYMTSCTAINGENNQEVHLIVPNNEEELYNIININDVKNHETITLNEDEIYLTDKAAQLIGVKQGDTIIIEDNDNNRVSVKVSGVVENYIMHYMYMTKSAYEKLYNKKYDTNVLLVKNVDLDDVQENSIATEIINQHEVAGITRTSTLMKTLDDTMKSLNYVVIILIVSAGLLAFVVLYNLSNVNISERIRELATIKVLGFYDKEVYTYVTKETILLTAIGIILGLIGGYFLNYFIIGTCEINMLRFIKIINPMSYIYASAITIIFTAIVNLVTYFALKKIDMIESLKSVE